MFNSGVRGRRAKDGEGIVNPQTKFVQTISPLPTITSYSISGLDDLAADTAGGQTIIVNGTGFTSGISAILGGTQIGAVSIVSPTQLTFTSPAKSAGTYSLVVYTSSNLAAILAPGITYSSFPTFTTPAGTIGLVYETTAINKTIVATSDSAITYTLTSGSLPAGATLSSSGVITGTAPVDSGSTTYTFSIKATDAELQDVTRTFTLTVNTDVLTWVAPSSGATINLDNNPYTQALNATDAAGYSVSYTANALPTGLTLTSGTISGTATVDGTTTTLLTATAATTNRTATNTITWVVSLTDPYFFNNTLLLSSSTSNVSNSFVSDASINNQQLTVFGDTRGQTFHPYQPGYYSYQFNGGVTVDYLTFNPGTTFQFGSTNDFTIECWIYPTSALANQYIIDMRDSTHTTGFVLAYGPNLAGRLTWYNQSSNLITENSTYTKLNQWNHIAYVRQSNVGRLIVNGSMVNISVADTTNYNNTNTIAYIGSRFDQNTTLASIFTGYISNLRVVNGTALYTSSGTTEGTVVIPSLPTTPLLPVTKTILLLGQSNRFADNSASNFTLTVNGSLKVSSANPFTTQYVVGTQYYSTSFNGSSDYLTLASNSAFSMGSNNFTIECWFYTTSVAGTQVLIDQWNFGSTRFLLRLNTTSLQGYFNTATSQSISGGTVTINTWYHAALVRNGSTFTLYLNGVSVGTPITDSTAIASGTTTLGIGGYGSNFMTGLISNARIVNGTALYTSSFTPSTTPLTAVANTVLLTCQDSTFKDNSTNNFTITAATTTVKPLAVSPFTPNSYTNTTLPTTYGSGYFNGSTGYITLPSATLVPTNTYTIELWCYPTAYPTGTNMAAIYQSSSANVANFGAMLLEWYGTGTFRFEVRPSTGGTNILVSSATTNYALNQWYHIAVSVNAGSTILFVNGVNAGTGTVVALDGTQTFQSIGYLTNGYTTGESYFTGYISDFRITKGSALYLSNFVPGFISPLTNVTNTQLLTLQYNGSHSNNVVLDNSKFNNLVTRFGDTNVGTFSPYGDNFSVNFNRGYLSTTLTGVPAGTGSFTYEMFFFITVRDAAVANQFNLFSTRTSGTGADGIDAAINSSSQILVGTSGTTYLTSTATAADNTWHHLAIVRNGTTNCTVYLNGTSIGTFSAAVNFTSTSFYLGWYGGANQDWIKGYISNFRYTQSAVYTSNFTVTTTPLLVLANTQMLIGQTNRFIDLSPNQFTITPNAGNGTLPQIQKFSPFKTVTVSKYYSMSLPANGSYYTGSNSNFNITATTVAWTFECWVFARANGGYFFAIGSGSAYGNSLTLTYGAGTASKFSFYQGNGSNANPVSVTSTNTYNLNTWYHYAVTRTTAGVMTQYINGVADGTVTYNAATVATGTTFVINGLYDNNGLGNNGGNYAVSNLRFIINQSLYSGNFTPPTILYTASQVGSTGAGAAASITGTVVLLTAQNILPIDNSGLNLAITSVGTASIISASPFTPTVSSSIAYTPATFGGSMYFDGSGDYLTIPYQPYYDIPASTAFTFECWVYTSSTNTFIMAGRNWAYGGSGPTWSFFLNSGTTPSWGIAGTGSSTYNLATSPTGGTLNSWNHYAFTRDSSGVVRIFVNGIVTVSRTDTQAMTSSSGAVYVGSPTNNAAYSTGYMCDMRIISGQALYTSSFLPPTSPLTSLLTVGSSTYTATLLLNGTSGGLIDASRTINLETLGDAKVTPFSPYNGTYYSVLFNGSTDYISIPTTSGNLDQTGDFTYDMWVYWLSMPTTGYQNISGQGTAGQSSYGLYAANASANTWSAPYVFKLNIANTGDVLTGNTTLVAGQWYHLAHTRTSGVNRLFVNGVLQTNTYTDSTSRSFANNPYLIGQNSNCYISNFRYIKGTSLYTNTFTPPTVPSTSVTNTALLTCQSNKFIDNSTNAFAITLAGTPKVQTQNPFQVNTGQSYYFDGAGDYLTTPTTNFGSFGTGDFTIEYWWNSGGATSSAYATQLSQGIVATPAAGAFSCGTRFNTTSAIWFAYYNGSAFTDITSSTVNVNDSGWHHLAFTRQSGTLKLFVDGVQLTSATVTQSLGTTDSILIGYNTRNSAYIAGYISDFRITRGYARYTTAFTPPTSPLKLS